ncbi:MULTISPECIES: DMT family transporter [Acinetobacter]|jgi:DME family drug/metabolite transporter|uniref:DMT family transporter n=1 Tax=Acinetobacter TaxID=469 RepID=UPI00077E28EE|nr:MULTISPECIES: EamA family transporter [Acinetobacter]MCG9483154.1 EamA family transporter [Acinetobacter pittii]MCU4503620.1 EamA family transporter [Acinetobacter sp. WU_MDCI_Abxe161]MCU4528668.1 EamA family transporter [Acinetobacter sp. WU_MDCI_Abxe169]MDC0840752.1 EamA family transporter [Acinetobacter sp. P1(2023)]MDX8237173.1 EamA family transporter [Acinetobacter pittii]
MSTPTEAKFSLNYYTGFLSVLFAAFLWGTAGTAASFAKGISPLVIATISVGFGGLIHTFLSLKAIKNNYQKLFNYKSQIFIAVVVSILCPFAFYSSVSLAGVSIGTVISIGCAPLFSVLLEWILDKRKLSLKWLISFILGFLGIILLSYAGDHAQHQVVQSDRILGVFFGLLSSLSYATYSWIMRNLIRQDVDSRAAMGVIFGISAVLLLPTLLITAQNLFDYPTNVWVAIYIPIVPMFLGYLFFSFGLKRIPASQAMTLALVEIPVAALLAVVVVGESLTMHSYLGLILIFLCVIVLTKK